MSVLGYTKEASHWGYFLGRSTALIPLSSKTKQHRDHGRKATVPTAWTLLKAVHNNATSICPSQNSKEKSEPSQMRYLAQVTEDPWKWAPLFPPQQKFTKFPPSIWEWILFYIPFISKTRTGLPCDSSLASSPTSLLSLQSLSHFFPLASNTLEESFPRNLKYFLKPALYKIFLISDYILAHSWWFL